LRGLLDRFTNADIGPAAADVAGHCVVDVGICRMRLAREQRRGRHDPARLAVAALNDLPVEPGFLVTRPTLNTYAAARADLSAMAKDLFGVVLSGAVKIEIKQTYPLKDAAQAHRDLESRKTVGSTVLMV
jgi:NADPH:quinone reductase